ncbi:MAG: hypothetical protein K6L76_13395 [Agarilytica sp.]
MFTLKHVFMGGAFALSSMMADAQIASRYDISSTLSTGSLLTSNVVVQDEKQQESGLKAVGNSDVAATIVVNGEKLEVRGRSSFHLNGTADAVAKGEVSLGALNLVFFDVPQAMLNDEKLGAEKNGTLSFVGIAGQTLHYDARSASFEGEVEGFISADYMAEFAPALKDSAEGDHTKSPRQKASMRVRMQLSEALSLKESEESRKDRIEAEFILQADDDPQMSAYPLEIELRPIYEFEYIVWWRFEIAKRLCVQPVRFSRLIWNWPLISWDYTGAGLGFGQPEADSQWAKSDVVFTWRDWIAVYNPTLFNFSTSEASDVLDAVDEDDCVEVFFVEGDDGMHNNWGGGASFNGGEAFTKIISSDGNVDAGVDFVHLAHELGHSMDLPHPNAWNSSSTNTLMCPSGYANDNPDRNSQENEDSLSNPLFTFALKLASPGPDCTNSADCGACPPIP